MDKKPKNKKWWLYGALASFIIAIAGVLLLFFVFNDGKKHRVDDDDDDEDEDDIELVDDEEQVKDDKWDDDWDDWDEEIVVSDSVQPVDIAPTDNDSPGNDDQTVYDVVEQEPEFLEGDLSVWLGSHLQYPPEAQNNGLQGAVVCQFIVEKDGSVGNVTVLRSIDPLLDKEAVRVIESMPKWAPGRKDGKPVRVKYTLPVRFQLQ